MGERKKVEGGATALDSVSWESGAKAAKLTRSAEHADDGSPLAAAAEESSRGEADASLRMEDWEPNELLAALGLEQGPSAGDSVQLASVYLDENGGGGGASSQPASQPSSQPASQPSSQPASQPAGETSWVESETKKVEDGQRTVTGKEYPTFEDVALHFFGKKSLWPFVAKANPSLKPTKIGPKTKIKVPASLEIPSAAKQVPGEPSSNATRHTWNVEGNAADPTKTRTPTVPTDSSGVTLGRGYDMKERSAALIESELIAATIDAALAKRYGGAAKKSGAEAKKWIKDNGPFTAITEGQEKALFQGEYQRQTDATVAFLTEPDRGYVQDGEGWKLEINFKDLKPEILAFLVDLKFRGDLKPSSWAYIKTAVIANDLESLKPLVAKKVEHKKHFFDNYVRYKARCEIVGATPVSEEDWKK